MEACVRTDGCSTTEVGVLNARWLGNARDDVDRPPTDRRGWYPHRSVYIIAPTVNRASLSSDTGVFRARDDFDECRIVPGNRAPRWRRNDHFLDGIGLR